VKRNECRRKNNLSCEEGSGGAIPSKKEIAPPFGLATTAKIFIPSALGVSK